ncbi:hypothetical protein IX84_20260 [Phaeodactylibacter xiamenensis]|uniref:Glycosyltransferase n=2 Tax=Phaeodactylibacter xiamenensis TaxID=1524460 RepID=A0A098S3A4_9BACT|nr:hypothetical protein IX84_20260 [Phaeodactylibacter xiamenensis]
MPKVQDLKRKLIVIVIGTLKGMGGAERQAILLAEELLQRGFKVKLIAFSGGSTETVLQSKGIPYTVYPFNSYQPFKRNLIPLLKLTLFLRGLKPYAFIPFITLNSKYIGLVWKLTGAQFACWNQRDEGREVYGSRLERWSINNVPVVVSNSWPGRNVLIEKLGVAASKVSIINNGIVLPEVQEKAIDWHDHLKLSKDTMIVSMLASIYKFKDHTTLIKAWQQVQAQLKARNKSGVLVLAGTFKGMETALKVLCFDLRVADSVYFIGTTPHTNDLIRQSAMVVHSSNLEGCPNAVLEAMALGKPVVATHIPGHEQALGDTYAQQCLSHPNDDKDLAAKMIKVLEDKALAKELGAYNRQRIKDHFSIEQMVDHYLGLITRYTSAS